MSGYGSGMRKVSVKEQMKNRLRRSSRGVSLGSGDSPPVDGLFSHTLPMVEFHVVKIKSQEKKQKRILALSPAGVSNSTGSTTKWFVDMDHVHRMECNGSNLKLSIVLDYYFETQSSGESERIAECLDMMRAKHKEREGGGGDGEDKGKEQYKRLSVDDFEIMGYVGVGRYGKVVQVRSKLNHRIYAMKVLRKADLAKCNQVANLWRERRIMSQIRHPFLVHMHHCFQTEDRIHMVMDYVPGGELFYHLRRAGAFPPSLARFYAAELVLAIQFLHSHSIIYRDLKPENILLDEEGHIKLTDFGLSKEGVTSMGGSGQGSTKTFCGTPGYLAPEIILDVGHGKGVDYWSIGILLYEMLVGQLPYAGSDPNEMYIQTLESEIEYPEDMDENAVDLLRQLLVKNPKDRMSTSIRQHAFFHGIHWLALENLEVMPPFRPKTQSRESLPPSAPPPESIEEEKESEPLSASVQGMFENFTMERSSVLQGE